MANTCSHILICCLLVVSLASVTAQKQANIWYFGTRAGLDFNSGTPPSILTDGKMDAPEGCASIADASGSLLFYTNGERVWNKNHNIMANSTGLWGDESSTQSTLIAPFVGNKDRYYIFTTDGVTSDASVGVKGKWDGLMYSVVNMTANGGLGRVEPGMKNISMVDSTREQVTAIMHANGIDYWVITRKQYTNKYYAFLVTCNGIDVNMPVVTTIGSTNQTNTASTSVGYLKASPAGDALLSAFAFGHTEIYDFDKATGQLSNARRVTNDMEYHYGVSFSPDGSVLYVAGKNNQMYGGRICSYQRYAPNIRATETVTSFPGNIIHGLQLAPDGKIYFTHSYFGQDVTLGAIINPNNFSNPGFDYNHVALGGKKTRAGLTNIFESMFYYKPDIAGNDKEICNGTATQIGTNPVIGLGYFWIPASGLSNSTISNPSASPTITTKYILGAYNACDTIYDTVVVAVVPAYSLTITPSAQTACSGEMVSLQASGANTYTWLPVTGLSNTTGSIVNSTSSVSTTYSVTGITNDGCIAYGEVLVTILPLPSLALNASNISLCEGESITLSASGAEEYFWLPHTGLSSTTGDVVMASPLISTTYSVTATGNNGCSVINQVVITVFQPPQVTITSSALSVCFGDSTTLAGFGASSYVWSSSNGISGTTGSVITVSPNAFTTYSVAGTDINGCKAGASIDITVNELPLVGFLVDSASGCAPVCINFVNTTPNTASLAWYFGNGDVSNEQHAVYCYSTQGVYTPSLYVTDINNCKAHAEVLQPIEVFPLPIAQFEMSSTILSDITPLVQFTDLSVGAEMWIWSFGDAAGSYSSLQHPQFTYTEAGDYGVTLSVFNQWGCADSAIWHLKYLPEFSVYIPNSFTPNDDGLNDFFSPVGVAINPNGYLFRLFDRWGNLIFQTNNSSIPWNGKNDRNIPLQQDTYVWQVVLEDTQGQKHQYTGHVNLLR